MEEVNIVNTVYQDDHQNGGPGLCTPFCVSACCAVHACCNPQFESDLVSQNNAHAENSVYTIRFTPFVVVSIWQPPKLA